MNFAKISVLIVVVLMNTNWCLAQMQIDWVSRYSGAGSLEDAGLAICVDDSGNVYVTGGVQTGFGYKCTTIKYNKNGDSLWVRDFRRPGNNYNSGNDIKLDDSGNVLIAGAESIIKYDKSGNLKWTAYDSADYNKLILDSLGNIYIAGIGSGKYVVAKYDRNGNRFWVNRYPGAYRLNDLTLDNMSNVLITGESEHAMTYYDYTTIKYTNSGNIIWIRKYNGPGPPPLALDIPYALTTDNAANVYVTGGSQQTSSSFYCATVKYDSSGNVIWIKRMYPPNVGFDIAVDEVQNVYITGRSSGNNCTAKLDINGNIMWTKTYPTTDSYATNISVLILDSVNNVYVSANIDSNRYTRYGAIKYDNNGNQLFVVNYHYTNVEFNYVIDMAIDKKGSVYLTGTSNNAYATVKFSPIPTGIYENNFIPDKYLLSQNYPNPFNPNTIINYQLSMPRNIKLKVYDVLGNEVASLVNEKKEPGSYEVEFHAGNLSSGIYFYRLEVEGNVIDTKRMVLLK